MNGPANNRLIAIVLKGLQGPVRVAGKSVNNTMQAWEGQYTDEQLSAILTYERSDFGNNAPPIPPAAVKQMREELKSRTEQWTFAELMKLPEKDLTQAGSKPAPAAQPAAAKPGAPPQAPPSGNQPPTPAPSPPPAGSQQHS